MLKWITKEHTKVNPHDVDDSIIIGLEIDDMEYYIEEDDDELCIHTSMIKKYKVTDLPDKLYFIPCESFSDSYISNTLPGEIARHDKSLILSAYLHIEDDYPVSSEYASFKRNKKKILKLLENDKKYSEIEVDENKQHCTISFVLTIKGDSKIEDVINLMRHEVEYIYEYLQEDDIEVSNEDEFTKKIVIPALINIGMEDVIYNHGSDEYGKDIIYKFIDNLGDIQYGAAQVKLGNISGKSNGDIDGITSQIDDAFSIPYEGISNNERNIKITQLLIICSGNFTRNAKKKIREKVNESYNVKYLDGEKINRYLNK